MRWLVLTLWFGALIRMEIYGIDEEQGVAANQLHLLFLPIMTCFGLAYLFVQWNRIGLAGRLPRLGFITALFVLCAWSMVSNLTLARQTSSFRWPPYAPPYIRLEYLDEARGNHCHRHARGGRLVCRSARRRAARYDGGPVKGLYLTPISGAQNKLRDILKGE
ncbi:MAG: hypothetical protein ABIR29_06140 [Chthoniobacterales bacterium]